MGVDWGGKKARTKEGSEHAWQASAGVDLDFQASSSLKYCLEKRIKGEGKTRQEGGQREDQSMPDRLQQGWI